MIPKIIHYCWFGRGPKSKLIEMCIESWRKYLPDYEIIEWNEDNFDIDSSVWTRQAYDCKKYAFVADYVRFVALLEYGGLYLDTDSEVIRSMDDLLDAPAFSGFEAGVMIQAGVMGSEKGGVWVQMIYDYYKDRPYIREDGTPEPITVVSVITNMLKEYGFEPNDKYQFLNNMVKLYPTDYLCPKSMLTMKVNLTRNTYTIHHYDGSWISPQKRLRKKIRQLLPTKLYLWMRQTFLKRQKV